MVKLEKSEREAEPDNGDEKSPKKMKLAPAGESEITQKIINQLDYYFSDVNIIKDKFLLEEFKKDDGWVKISVLLTFVRLKQITSDEDRIVQALKEVKSEIIELDESKKRVKRRNPVPDADFQKGLELRTVHISGFPTDYDFESLHKFCSQLGEVESVAMRRHFKTRFFKGCIHVVFKKEEDAKKVLETEPLKCKDRELRKESMEDYHKRKAEMAKKRSEHRKKDNRQAAST